MPQYLITSPDGKKYRVTAPEGATKEQALERVKSMHAAPKADTGVKNILPPEIEPPDETMADIGKSAILRGAPEGLMAATPLGMGANLLNLGATAGRWAGGKVYEAATGEELPHYTPNPIPTSTDILETAIGTKLYEPTTPAGQSAANVTSMLSGGMAAKLPTRTAAGAAVVSEGARKMAEGTDWEIPAQAAGAIAGGLGANRLGDALRKKPAIPMAAEKAAASSAAYKAAETNGGNLTPQFTNQYLDKIKTYTPQTSAGKIVAGDNEVTKIAQKMENLRDSPLTLAEVQELDEHLGDVIDGLFSSGNKKQAGRVIDMQTDLREMIENAPASSVGGGKAGFDSLKEARSLWSQQARLRDLEKIITRAEMMDVPATGIKTGFRTLYNNEKRMRGYTPEQKALIKRASQTGIVTEALRLMGSRLNPIIVGASGALPAAAATAGFSALARKGAEAIQKGKANDVRRSVGGQAPAKSTNKQILQGLNKPLQKPLLTPFTPKKPLKLTIRK
jgi:hypothetical protein